MKMQTVKDGVKLSIIVVSYNTIIELAKCVESIFCYTQDFELILVDNGSTDGSAGYIGELVKQKKNVKAIFNTENKNFGPANNQGVEVAEGQYIVCLNSDCYVTLGWSEKMIACMKSDPSIAIVGPVSNSSNGRQQIAGDFVGMKTDAIAAKVEIENLGRWADAGILYGWCMLIRREFLEKEPYLFDEQFENSYEDNDLCMRARLNGWRLVIDCSTFLFHEGQMSFKKILAKDNFALDYMANGNKNQVKFFDKWRDDRPKKLIAVYRIANCEQYLAKSLEQTSKFADEIICLFARSSDSTKEIALSFPKVKIWQEWNEPEHPFNEQAERNWLLQKAISRGADWVISIDGDEVYEDKFIENVRGYMNPANPQVFGYWTNWRTIWETNGSEECFRCDGIFGGFQNYRFFRVLPGMKIKENTNLYNHHCGSAPFIPTENLKWLNIRVKHLGYDTEEQRQKKYNFYRAADPRPVRADVGNEDYHHLIDKNVQTKRYKERNRLSVFMVVRDEGRTIYDAMMCVEPVADEYVIIDTGSSDNTLAEVERFIWAARKNVRIIPKTFESMEDGYIMNYSEIMNFAKGQCRYEWVLRVDGDEMFPWGEVTNLFAFMDDDVDGYLFNVINYLEAPKGPRMEDNVFSLSETIRLFRNIDEIFYSGLLHESVEDSITARIRTGRGNMLLSPVMIHHRGYLKVKEHLRKKIDRYHVINKRQLEISGGKDPRPLFNMALHLINDGDLDGGIALYKNALDLDPQFWRASQNLGYHYVEIAKKYLQVASSQMPRMMLKNSKVEELLGTMNKYNFTQPKVA